MAKDPKPPQTIRDEIAATLPRDLAGRARLGSAQVAILLGVSRRTLWQAVRRGELPAGEVLFNGRRTWTVAQVDEAIAARAARPKGHPAADASRAALVRARAARAAKRSAVPGAVPAPASPRDPCPDPCRKEAGDAGDAPGPAPARSPGASGGAP